MTGSMEGSAARDYDALLAQGRALYPGQRIGRPGRSWLYWPTVAAMRLLRLRWKVQFSGAEHVARGPAILVANHLSAFDPVAVVVSTWWRVTAFTKAEHFASRWAFFFRWMGQIPLRRGDATCTDWAMQMSRAALAYGGMIAIYPEGTRSPDGRLHRLHKRVLIPLLQANPDVPVHVVTVGYLRRRPRVEVAARVSPRIEIDPARQSPDDLVRLLTRALLELGGQEYADDYARDVKNR